MYDYTAHFVRFPAGNSCELLAGFGTVWLSKNYEGRALATGPHGTEFLLETSANQDESEITYRELR